MCGIVGAVSLSGRPLPVSQLKPMADIVAHRGPDDAGYLVWQSGARHPRGLSFGQDFSDSSFAHLNPLLPVWDSPSGADHLKGDPWDVFLGHRRLSIIDLSPRGHQPMGDKSRRVWVTYNGEIYNYREIRKELESLGYHFYGSSDTEIIPYAYEEWGIDFVEKLNGIFAFALFDTREKRIFLVRDRYGVKPLYYTQIEDGSFLFGSEIKSFLKYPSFSVDVDLLALNEYFSFQNVLSDRTLFEGVRLLPPGTILTIDLATGRKQKRQYWDFDFSQEHDLSEEETVERLHELLQEAVRDQAVSDVPIGSYLSGGMDSGTITTLLAQNLGRIRTFTSGFDLSEAASHEMTFDERALAEQMANEFQTEHYECVLHSGDMEAVLPELIWHLEDPRVGQCYPNYYVARLAGRFGKVVMSGAGGDELFGGYPWRYAAALGADQDRYIENYYHYWQRLVRNADKPQLFHPDVTEALAHLTDDNGATPFKNHTLTVFRNVFPQPFRASGREQQINNSLYFEAKTFLHGLLLVEDKVSMAHSLETRVPFLNNSLVQFAMQTPVTQKLADLHKLRMFDENTVEKKRAYEARTAIGKNVLRKTMRRIIPQGVSDAKKQGFSAPDESWFRGRSADYVRDVLLGADSRLDGMLNLDFVRAILDEHTAGRANHRLLIWSFLNLEMWRRAFVGSSLEISEAER